VRHIARIDGKHDVRLPSGIESIAPVTILDAQGRIVRVVSAKDFRRGRLAATAETLDKCPLVGADAHQTVDVAHGERLEPGDDLLICPRSGYRRASPR